MQQTLIVPYLRTSPLRLTRRDLVLSAADSVELRVTIRQSDDPDSALYVLTGGIGGPAAWIVIWGDVPWHHDYGAVWSPVRSLWQGAGAAVIGAGSFDFSIPWSAIGGLPRRCGWSIILNWDGGALAETIAMGALHIMGAPRSSDAMAGPGTGFDLLTDADVPVLNDDSLDILV